MGGADPAEVVVDVTRTGGIAGMTRAWTAAPAPEQAPSWIMLIAQCPWDDTDDTDDIDTRGADRFQWRIRARCGPDDDRCAELPDRSLTGAWRDLVDAVKAWPDEPEPATSGMRDGTR